MARSAGSGGRGPPSMLPAASLLLLSSLLSPTLVASARRRLQPAPYPSDVVHKPDPTYCLSPINLKFTNNLRTYFFESSEDVYESRTARLIYAYGHLVAAIFVSARVPKLFLSEKIIEDPHSYLKTNYLSILGDLPLLAILALLCILLAVFVPVSGLVALLCRRRFAGSAEAGAENGAAAAAAVSPPAASSSSSDSEQSVNEEELRRNKYSAGLLACCAIMMLCAACSLIAHLHMSLGARNILPQSRRLIRDALLFFDKTKHEVDVLLVRDYYTFEDDFYRRIDSCVIKMSDDFKGIVGESPIETVHMVVNRVARIDKCLKEATSATAELNAAIRQLRDERVGIHFLIAAAVSDCAAKTPLPTYCTDLNRTFDLVPSKAASPDEVYLGGLKRFMTKLDVVQPSFLKTEVDLIDHYVIFAVTQAAQLPVTPDGVRHTLGEAAKQVKLEVEYFGSDLVDLVDNFTMEWVQDPGILHSIVRERYGFFFKAAEPYVRVLTPAGVSFVATLFLIVCLYSWGLAWFSWGTDAGWHDRRNGGWCLALGGFIFLLLFGYAMLATTVGVLTGFTLQRCGCDVMSDVSQPAFKDVLRVAMKVAHARNIGNGTRMALSHVSLDTVYDIAKRFSRCQEESLSIYNLLGEELMKNISSSVGKDWAFSWLWSDLQDPDLSDKLSRFADPKTPLLMPEQVRMLSDLEPKLSGIKGIQFDRLNAEDYILDMNSVDFNTDAFNILYKRLSLIQDSVDDPSIKKKVADVVQQVTKTVSYYANAEPLKAKVIHLLEELVSLKTIENETIDVFYRDHAANLTSRTPELRPALARVLGGSGRYKQQMNQLVNIYKSHVANEIKEDVGRCGPAYTIYKSALKAACSDLVAPYNNFWVYVLTYMLVGLAAFVLSISLSTMYARFGPPSPAAQQGTGAEGDGKKAEEDKAKKNASSSSSSSSSSSGIQHTAEQKAAKKARRKRKAQKAEPKSGEPKPEDKPGETKNDEPKPDEPKNGEPKLDEPKPGVPKAAGGKPGESKPAEQKSAEPKLAERTPSKPTLAQTRTVESQPASPEAVGDIADDVELLVRPFSCGIDRTRPPGLASPKPLASPPTASSPSSP